MIQYLADQLGIPMPNARILYDQWLENTLNSLSNGKPVTIEGLGSFTFDNNELKFAPQPSLELDVNRAYAGLEPLPEEKLGPTKVVESDFEDPFLEIIAPKPSQPEVLSTPAPTPAPEPEPFDPFEPDPVFEEETAPAPEPEPEPEPVRQPQPEAQEAMEPTPDQEKKPANLTPWIIAALVLIVVSIAGTYGVDVYKQWMESKLASEQTVATVPDTGAATDSAAVAAAASTGYGLTGSPITLEGRVYAIIVHSLPVKGDSEAQCAKISPLGFRCSVVAADRNGATTYRVALGQFESNEAAQAAVAQLPAEYQTPGNFFIARIQ